MNNVKIDSCLYLLTMLFQRLQESDPKIVEDMITGIKADQSSLPKDITEKVHVEAIFEESLQFLKRLENLNKNA